MKGGIKMADNGNYIPPNGGVDINNDGIEPRDGIAFALALIVAYMVIVNAAVSMNGFFTSNVDANWNNLYTDSDPI